MPPKLITDWSGAITMHDIPLTIRWVSFISLEKKDKRLYLTHQTSKWVLLEFRSLLNCSSQFERLVLVAHWCDGDLIELPSRGRSWLLVPFARRRWNTLLICALWISDWSKCDLFIIWATHFQKGTILLYEGSTMKFSIPYRYAFNNSLKFWAKNPFIINMLFTTIHWFEIQLNHCLMNNIHKKMSLSHWYLLARESEAK